ncbi:starch synthase [candidate division KSB3 bacterium]|uniref:Glycogen synthase n=1 Tax=candidate division KSB3 bacterium TaxID=2044937 RepID=A0A2G6E4C2_9BACT|nr:MAG: starch synthase [candidate division KSB3 bacterium]PIE29173.1 MAG: starch synthase [candidate division KSB3 bacterium]
MPRPLKIAFIASEVDPIVSTGELGRAVGGLARALKGLGVDARVVIPRYPDTNGSSYGQVRLVPEMTIRSVNRFGETAIYRHELSGEVPVYLIDKPKYFDRDYLYGPPESSYQDNAERFSFFDLAALEMFTQIGFFPDIVHCHDWHTGLIPAYLKTLFQGNPLYAMMKTLFAVHNLRHQGCFPKETLSVTGLPDSIFCPEGLEFYGKLCFLKSGLVYADALIAASKRYSQEIQTTTYGRGLEGMFQKRSKALYGVIDGVEYKQFDPRIDPYIAANYTKDELERKELCRQDLLKACSLDSLPDVPLLGMVAPLYEEKGFDLLAQAFDELIGLPVRFIFLNDRKYQNAHYARLMEDLMARHRRFARCYTGADEELKHKLMAGADLLLMPFQSEPCGVNQMFALKYGTIPLVHATGGLDDTVSEFSPESRKGTGFKFRDYTPGAFVEKIREALVLRRNRSLWELLQVNAMRVDYSWVYSAKKYLDIYKIVMGQGKSGA